MRILPSGICLVTILALPAAVRPSSSSAGAPLAQTVKDMRRDLGALRELVDEMGERLGLLKENADKFMDPKRGIQYDVSACQVRLQKLEAWKRSTNNGMHAGGQDSESVVEIIEDGATSNEPCPEVAKKGITQAGEESKQASSGLMPSIGRIVQGHPKASLAAGALLILGGLELKYRPIRRFAGWIMGLFSKRRALISPNF